MTELIFFSNKVEKKDSRKQSMKKDGNVKLNLSDFVKKKVIKNSVLLNNKI